jgi:prephenate dehydrogenase
MKIGIIGVGLIGGSLAITLKENGFASKIYGVDANQDNLDKAIRRKLIDETIPFEKLTDKVDLIVIAIPVDGISLILPQLLNLIGDQQVITDVGSTKSILMDLVNDHPRRGRYVSGHPMAGTEFSGPEAAIPDLFKNKYTVLCDTEHSDSDALDIVERMYDSIPMKRIYLNAKDHDIHTAYVSHISHISSFALALTVLAKEADENRIFELAGSGFSSTVRLAKSSPKMWVPIFKQNRDNVLDVLDEHINQLSQFRSMLIKRDFEGMDDLIKRANAIRDIFERKGLI